LEKQVINLGKGPLSTLYLLGCVYLRICCFDWAVGGRVGLLKYNNRHLRKDYRVIQKSLFYRRKVK